MPNHKESPIPEDELRLIKRVADGFKNLKNFSVKNAENYEKIDQHAGNSDEKNAGRTLVKINLKDLGLDPNELTQKDRIIVSSAISAFAHRYGAGLSFDDMSVNEISFYPSKFNNSAKNLTELISEAQDSASDMSVLIQNHLNDPEYEGDRDSIELFNRYGYEPEKSYLESMLAPEQNGQQIAKNMEMVMAPQN